MLNVLYEKCFAAIQYLVSIVVLKRVNSAITNSVASVGSAKWVHTCASAPHHRIMRDLMSPAILQYIKDEILNPARKELKRAFFSAVVVVDPIWRQAALYDLLLKCRWEETRSIAIKKKKMMLYEHMPVLTERDARTFIQSGADPLSAYIKSCDDALIVEDSNLLENSSSIKRQKPQNYNLFLAHVTATDMVDIIFESINNTIAQPFKRNNTDSRASLHGDGAIRSRDGNSASFCRRMSHSRELSSRTPSRHSLVLGDSTEKDFDECSDTQSVRSSYSVNSRHAVPGSAASSGRRHSRRRTQSVRKTEQKNY